MNQPIQAQPVQMRPLGTHPVGAVIQALRKRKRWSQTVLAEKANISRPYLSEIELGRTNVSLDIMGRVFTALGYQISFALREQEGGAPVDLPGSLPSSFCQHCEGAGECTIVH